MFTGIIEEQGSVLSITKEKVPRLVVEKPAAWEFKIGASVAVDGVCLTVVEQTTDSFSADVVPETIARTTVGNFVTDRKVNLERPLRMGDEIGGHLVQGHVDTRINVVDIKQLEASREITFTLPEKYQQFVIEKGSIAINGTSLTIARIKDNTFTIALVPHTLAHTNLGSLQDGDEVNVEFDASVVSGKL